MIHIIGINEIIKNIAILGALKSKKLPKNFEDLEYNFHNFLKNHQPNVPRLEKLGTNIIQNNYIENKLADLYKIDSILNDRNQSTIIGNCINHKMREKYEKHIVDSIENIKLKIPNIYNILQLVIDSLFIRNSKNSGGGSTSNGI